MTCVVGVAKDGIVYMGADSIATDGWRRGISALDKIFKVGGRFLIGYCGSFRMGQILRYHLDVRQQKDAETDECYMVTAFVEAVRACLKDKGFTHIENNTETGGSFLVGYRGCLYVVDEDFQVNRPLEGVAAIGAGADYALGALVALRRTEPKRRIANALYTAEELSTLVAEPFRLEQLG
jgi:ATP-dependent protease HslVU (ClpYQ) peptidase subunit